MHIVKLRDPARPKLSLRYGAIHQQRAEREGTRPNSTQPSPMPTTELRRVVASMID
jgi:hypothetical protein